jgi:HK97 family phage prohead protease
MNDDELTQHRNRIMEGLEVRADDDGHFVRGIVAPYNVPADIGGEYVETLEPGLFKKSIAQRGDRIGLKEQHGTDRFDIGRSSSWEETSDGLVGTFRLAGTDRAREALTLIREGFLDGLSVGFRPLRNRVTDEGGRRHVARVDAALDHVGLVHSPAYDGARVLEARDDEPVPFDPDSVLAAPKLARYRALLGMRNR